MELVVDANILVAGALRAAVTRELLLDNRLTLWSPEHILVESERNLSSLVLLPRLSNLSKADVMDALDQITDRIRVIPISGFRTQLQEAHRLAPHPEDAPYLALAMHLHCALWSNDAGFKKQKLVPVFATHELLAMLFPSR